MAEGVDPNPEDEQFTSHIDDELREISAGMNAASQLSEADRHDDEQVANFRVADALRVGPDGRVNEVLHPQERIDGSNALTSEQVGKLAEHRQRQIRELHAREGVVEAAGKGEATGRHRRHSADQASEELRPVPPADSLRRGRHRAKGQEPEVAAEVQEPRSAVHDLSPTQVDRSDEGSRRRREAAREVAENLRGDREFRSSLANGELHAGDVGAVQQMALAAEVTLSKAEKARAKGQHAKAELLEKKALDEMGGAEFAHVYGEDIRNRRRRPWQFWRR
jgi:hypothetical protein